MPTIFFGHGSPLNPLARLIDDHGKVASGYIVFPLIPPRLRRTGSPDWEKADDVYAAFGLGASRTASESGPFHHSDRAAPQQKAVPEPPPHTLRHRHCSICSHFDDWEHALEHVQSEPTDTRLPEAADRLEVVRDIIRHDLQLKQCPECGTYYLYRSIYEFLIGFGGSYDEYFLVRLTDEVAADYREGRRSEPLKSMY